MDNGASDQMTIKFVDGLVTELQTYLVTNLNTKVSAVNTLFGDTLLTDFVTTNIRTDDPREGAPVVTPSLHIIAISAGLPLWRDGMMQSNVNMLFWLTARHQVAQSLKHTLYRYSLALWNTLVAGHADGTITWKMDVGEPPQFDFTETYGADAVLYGNASLSVGFEQHEVA